MDCLFENPPDIDLWRQAFLAKFRGQGRPFEKKDWDQLLGHCQAVTDLPTSAFVPELLAAYPDAKLIITPRGERLVRVHLLPTHDPPGCNVPVHPCMLPYIVFFPSLPRAPHPVLPALTITGFFRPSRL